jgi:hypothetical protein
VSEHSIRLGDLAQARSGDKGNRANIGVVANDLASYNLLRSRLTAEVVASYFTKLEPKKVVRYELPGVLALNFVLDRALAGGASGSLRIDTQGKALGSALMELRIPFESGEGL